ncbi:MAG: hypothetical protein U9N40_00400 [Euryarchaeota archaeon]|nr:hypothetical protein [Euryarchaeota archaeon]
MNEITGEFTSGKIFLALSEATHLSETNYTLVKQLSDLQMRTIVITVNQPSPTLKTIYRKKGIDISRVLFIDAITKYALGGLPTDIDNAIFIGSPGNLTEIGIGITEMLKENPDEKTCVIIDSVNTMLVYLPDASVLKFIHFLSSKLRLMDSIGVFLAVEAGIDSVLMTQLTTFADEVLEVPTLPIEISKDVFNYCDTPPFF